MGCPNDANDFDIEVRRRSRAPTSMSTIIMVVSMELVRNTGIVIHDGGSRVLDKINENNSTNSRKGKQPFVHNVQYNDNGDFVEVDFSCYNCNNPIRLG